MKTNKINHSIMIKETAENFLFFWLTQTFTHDFAKRVINEA